MDLGRAHLRGVPTLAVAVAVSAGQWFGIIVAKSSKSFAKSSKHCADAVALATAAGQWAGIIANSKSVTKSFAKSFALATALG